MNRFLLISLRLIFLFFAIDACRSPGKEYNFEPIVKFSIKDDLGSIVSGAKITVYTSDIDYANAVLTKNYAVNAIASTLSDNNGNASITLTPGKEYYILITYFDNTRFLNISNITTGGYFDGRDLAQGQTIYLDIVIVPDDGNIIFYTTSTNKIPIEISFSPLSSTNTSLYTLSGIYTLGTAPKPQNPNTVSVYQSPGVYRYYAKSLDGCLWSDTVTSIKGEIKLINLSKCESGTMYFYTTSVNDTLLPLSVKLNITDTAGSVTTFSGSPITCLGSTTNSLAVTRYKGLYTYYIESKSGRCAWTGSLSLAADDCIIIPIDTCQ